MVRMSDKDTGRAPSLRVLSPADAVHEALAFALDYCSSRIDGGADVVELLRQNDATAHDYLRYALALQVGRTLAEMDRSVTGVYVHDWDGLIDEMEFEPVTATSPLSLIVWVNHQSKAIQSLAAELDSILTQRYKVLLAPVADGLRSLLDVSFVDDAELRSGDGLGALFTSVRQKPLKVWPGTRG